MYVRNLHLVNNTIPTVLMKNSGECVDLKLSGIASLVKIKMCVINSFESIRSREKFVQPNLFDKKGFMDKIMERINWCIENI